MPNTILRDVSSLLKQSAKNFHAKQQRQLEAIHKNEALRQSIALKTALTPHLEKILHNNIYFHGYNRINISDCEYDSQYNAWKISAETSISTEHAIENPRVIVSLNNSADIYFSEMRMQLQYEYQQLQLMSQAQNVNLLHIQAAQLHLHQKYEILSHIIRFIFIKRIHDDAHIVELGIIFR